MRKVTLRDLPFWALVCAALAAPVHASAQWKWVDRDGRVTYSDLPPPAGTQGSRVTIRPDVATPVPPPSSPSPPGVPVGAGSPAGAGVPGTPSVADRAAAFEARRQEREAAQRAAELRARESETLARACEQLRGSLRTLESGMRLAETGPDGERRVVDSDERTARIEETRRALRTNCGGE